MRLRLLGDKKANKTIFFINFNVLLFSVASQVLNQDKLELEGYLLKIKEKQPEIFLPLDKKKLYVENLNPNTSKDSLENYIELTSKLEVLDVQFGENRNALVTFSEEPGINMQVKRLLNNKHFGEARLAILVCHIQTFPFL